MPHLLDEALGARALYLDALRSLFYSSSLHGDLQHSVLEAGVDLALVGALRQRHAATEGAVAALPDMVATTLLFFIDLVLAGDRQHPVLQGDVHILCKHVHSRRPLAELLASLTPPPAKTAQHLVEEAIHLTLHIVKAAKWTQHDPHTSFSSWPTQTGTDLPSERALYTPSYSFQTVLPINLQVFLGIHSSNRVLIQFMVCSCW